MKANEYVKQNGWTMAKKAVAECTYGYGINLNDLKRLVESHELIEACGGIDVVKRHLKEGNVFRFEEKPLMRQAIADVESCK